MADIKINDIQPAGMELFGGDESFIDDLDDQMSQEINGGSGRGFCSMFSLWCSRAAVAIH